MTETNTHSTPLVSDESPPVFDLRPRRWIRSTWYDFGILLIGLIAFGYWFANQRG